ncbi:hypothetical protein [Kitasatospora cineracea]|uniref:hypothetical protein n=1 Tax=Kitasatospora cineracea TaxID=88074 RepID=UPI001ABF014C|nr:hypothetical protein [Kitasatospora cineracea]
MNPRAARAVGPAPAPAGALPPAPAATAAACAAFVLIGALQALCGPAIPALRPAHGIAPATAGLALSAPFTGAIAGVVLYHRLKSRDRTRAPLLPGSLLLTALAAAAGYLVRRARTER